MMRPLHHMRVGVFFFLAMGMLLVSANSVSAWTNPPGNPPPPVPTSAQYPVSNWPPINTGYTAQDKTGPLTGVTNPILTLGGLTVFGNLLVEATQYINWGTGVGSSGYGFRSNGGVMQFKNSGGAWTNIAPVNNTPSAFQQHAYRNQAAAAWHWCDIPSLTNITCETIPANASGWTQETGTGGLSLYYKEISGQGTTPWTICAMNSYTTPYDHETLNFVLKKPNNKWYIYFYLGHSGSSESIMTYCWR